MKKIQIPNVGEVRWFEEDQEIGTVVICEVGTKFGYVAEGAHVSDSIYYDKKTGYAYLASLTEALESLKDYYEFHNDVADWLDENIADEEPESDEPGESVTIKHLESDKATRAVKSQNPTHQEVSGFITAIFDEFAKDAKQSNDKIFL